MKNLFPLFIGIALLFGGIFGAQMEIDTTWHYFGNGVVFGVGLMIVASWIWKRIKK